MNKTQIKERMSKALNQIIEDLYQETRQHKENEILSELRDIKITLNESLRQTENLVQHFKEVNSPLLQLQQEELKQTLTEIIAHIESFNPIYKSLPE